MLNLDEKITIGIFVYVIAVYIWLTVTTNK